MTPSPTAALPAADDVAPPAGLVASEASAPPVQPAETSTPAGPATAHAEGLPGGADLVPDVPAQALGAEGSGAKRPGARAMADALGPLSDEVAPEPGATTPSPGGPRVAATAPGEPEPETGPAARVANQPAPSPESEPGLAASSVTPEESQPRRQPKAIQPRAQPTGPGPDVPAPAAPRQHAGLGLGRPLIRLDGPRSRLSDRPSDTISGTVVGAALERLVLYVNDVPHGLPADQGSFRAPVTLEPGPNHLRAVATGPGGLEAEDTVTIEYRPPARSNGIVITKPADRLGLGSDDPPFVVVEGRVQDRDVPTVALVVNDRRVAVRTVDGRFRQVVPVLETVIRIWAEHGTDAGAVHRSQTVTVHGPDPVGAPTALLVMDWPDGTDGAHIEMTATWRARAETLDVPDQTVSVAGLSSIPDRRPSEVFYVKNLKPGVYTFVLRYRAPTPLGAARTTLYLAREGRLSPRALEPVSLNGSGRRVLARLLLPYGVLWEQDDWFSGRSESVDTVTKFRVPEGITWVERKPGAR